MADKEKRLSANMPGAYYVDQTCIGCQMCSRIAPDYFGFDAQERMAFVLKQPLDETGEKRCSAAKQTCPVGAIGDDGS